MKKRNITLKPVDKEKVYDGIEFTLDSTDVIDVNNDLVEGHSVTITSDSSFVNADIYDTIIKDHKIVNAEGEDVTSNYEHEYLTGLMIIIPRTIYVKPIDKDTIYDAEIYDEYNGTDYEVVVDENWIYDFIGSDGITVTVEYYLLYGDTCDPIDAGTYFIRIIGVEFNEGTIGTNYDVHYDELQYEARLRIDKRIINATAIKPDDRPYNGQYYYYDEFELNLEIVSGDGLANGESIIIYDSSIRYTKLDDSTFEGNPKNVGTYSLFRRYSE